MSSTRAPLFILALFFLCLYATGSVSSVDTWIDDGKGGVYWESSYGKISAYPAISFSDTYINSTTIYQPTGIRIDIYWANGTLKESRTSGVW